MMKTSQYIRLMENLDACINNGYEQYLFDTDASEILNEMIDLDGDHWSDVPFEEMMKAINKWKAKQPALIQIEVSMVTYKAEPLCLFEAYAGFGYVYCARPLGHKGDHSIKTDVGGTFARSA